MTPSTPIDPFNKQEKQDDKQNSKLPGVPQNIDLRNVYILFFIGGNITRSQEKYFAHNGGHKSAIDRGRLHCERLNIRFISVKPLLSDFEAEETRHQSANYAS